MATNAGVLHDMTVMNGAGVHVPASAADLAIGMQLLRASNMKALRLQLALIKQDRRLAIEAVDGLVDLDNQIESFINDMPHSEAAAPEMQEIRQWIETQKRAIASEKLVLACIANGPGLQARPDPLLASSVSVHAGDGPLDLAGYEQETLQIREGAEAATAGLDANVLYGAVAEIGEDVRRLPGRRFMLVTALVVQLVTAALIVFADPIRQTVAQIF